MGCWDCLVCSVISCNERLAPLFEEVLKLHSLASKHIFWGTSWKWTTDVWFFLGTSHFEKAMQNLCHANGYPNAKKIASERSPKLHYGWRKFPACEHHGIASDLGPFTCNPWIHRFYVIYIYIYIGESYMTPGIFPKQFKGKHWQIRIQIRQAAWQVHDGPEIALASFHGDTNGLLTIPMLSKVGGIWWEIPWWLKLKVIF